MNRILIVEDEEAIARFVELELRHEGYEVTKAADGRTGLELALDGGFDLMLLDIMLPELNGMEVIRRLRRESQLPVIMLTARDTVMDKVSGLDMGADDYITKPFDPVELLARVRSQLRRYLELGTQTPRPTLLRAGGIEMDTMAHTVTLDGEIVELTPRQYAILALFMEHPGTVLSPQEIYRRVWKETPIGVEKTVAVHIHHLREKLEINPAEPRLLKVVWGRGYRMERDKS